MQALTIEPNLNEFEDDRLGLGFGFKGVIGALSFQGGVETLHRGVIVTVAGAAHTYLALGQFQ